MDRIFKKLVSMLIVVCFTISAANLPAYSAIENIVMAQNQEEYNLQKEYGTPAATTAKKATTSTSKQKVTSTKVSSAVTKAAKQAINAINKLLKKKGVSKLAKTWLKKLKTLVNNIKNGKQTNAQKKTLLNKAITAIKAVTKAKGSDLSLAQQTVSLGKDFSALKTVLKKNLTYKIYAKYSTVGLTVVKALANKFGLKLKTVYNQFVKYEVTKAQMKKVASGLLKMIKRGADFCVCSTTAVSKYLGISKHFTAVQQIAAEISLNYFNPNNKSHYIATTNTANAKILSKNGVKNTEIYSVKLADLLSMKKGTRIYVSTDCYNKNGQKIDAHAITITREKSGKFGVYDILVNGGNKVIYTKAQIKRLLNGKSATGKTTSGRTITKSKYLNSADGYIRYKFVNYGGVSIIGDSTKIIGQYTKDNYKENISIINKLLKKSNLSDVAKTWLKKAKYIVNKIYKSNKKNSVKGDALNGAKYWLRNIKVGGATIVSIAEAHKDWSFMAPIFSSLTSVLKNNLTYKIFNNYGKHGVTLIRNLSKKFNVSQTSIYTQLVKSGVDRYWLSGASADKYKSLNDFYSSFGISVSQNNNNNNTQKEQDNVDTNSIEYKINAKYGDKGVSLIGELSKYLNLSQDIIYTQFVNNEVPADTVNIASSLVISDINKGVDIFRSIWFDDSLNNTLAALKQLRDNASLAA